MTMRKSKKEDAGFKTVDRRKAARKKPPEQAAEPAEAKSSTPLSQDEEVKAEAQPQEPQPAEEAPRAEAEEPSEQIPALDAYSTLRWCIGLLSAQAWQWLGLVAYPGSGEVKKDLEQARLSIDSVAALVERLAPRVEESEKRELENLVSNLRLNFVNQSQTGPSGH